jgi:anti-sigma factor RsiW
LPSPANDDAAAASPLHVTDSELIAYVEGGLTSERRTVIEGFLACNPDLAARVMTGLHQRGRTGARGRPDRLRARVGQAMLVVAVCAVAGFAGWRLAPGFGNNNWREPDGDRAPEYVEDAAMSQRTTQLRVAMTSQTETPTLNDAEIWKTLKLRIPALPRGWKVLDVQVYPSEEGPGVSLLVQAEDGRRLNLFAVRAQTPVSGTPATATDGQRWAVYWEAGDTAFVLLGDGTRKQLLAEADSLSRS